ncbi:LANO_0H04478g1_1 [Lachancea nothofagi CBS 11611]|uniref:LANO_0H04478g1_1 n=1 Tax=Lachancea nothofagi CBS 11611 TaxID=1266666 RepID=A0A1G4KL52_9SACH|nr:LANO_0H04478g1_1 [Lachancea nothofagi CBS 11611]
MEAISNDKTASYGDLKNPVGSWQEVQEGDEYTPRSSDAHLQVQDFLHSGSLNGDFELETNKALMEQLELVFQGTADCVSMRVPRLRSLETLRVKLLVSRLQIRTFVENEVTAALEVFGSDHSTGLVISSDSYHSVMVECPLDTAILQALCPRTACMLLSRELVHQIRTGTVQLQAVILELNSRSVTINGADPMLVFADLQKLANNSFYRCPQKPLRLITPSAMLEVQRTQHIVYMPRKSNVITHTLTLNKPEVTFLIGRQGSKIQELRQQSGATVKVLPIALRLTVGQLNNPTSIGQQLSITGSIEAVTKAVCLIDSQLSAYRMQSVR